MVNFKKRALPNFWLKLVWIGLAAVFLLAGCEQERYETFEMGPETGPTAEPVRVSGQISGLGDQDFVYIRLFDALGTEVAGYGGPGSGAGYAELTGNQDLEGYVTATAPGFTSNPERFTIALSAAMQTVSAARPDQPGTVLSANQLDFSFTPAQ